MFKRLLIATDGSELAGKAVATGLRLAKSLGAEAVAVVASEPWTAMVSGDGFALDFPWRSTIEAAPNALSVSW